MGNLDRGLKKDNDQKAVNADHGLLVSSKEKEEILRGLSEVDLDKIEVAEESLSSDSSCEQIITKSNSSIKQEEKNASFDRLWGLNRLRDLSKARELLLTQEELHRTAFEKALSYAIILGENIKIFGNEGTSIQYLTRVAQNMDVEPLFFDREDDWSEQLSADGLNKLIIFKTSELDDLETKEVKKVITSRKFRGKKISESVYFAILSENVPEETSFWVQNFIVFDHSFVSGINKCDEGRKTLLSWQNQENNNQTILVDSVGVKKKADVVSLVVSRGEDAFRIERANVLYDLLSGRQDQAFEILLVGILGQSYAKEFLKLSSKKNKVKEDLDRYLLGSDELLDAYSKEELLDLLLAIKSSNYLTKDVIESDPIVKERLRKILAKSFDHYPEEVMQFCDYFLI